MNLFFGAAFFALGATIASFVGVLVGRYRTGQSIVTGRSHCDACDRTLTFIALVPIFSYVALGGRARCCSARLSFLAPLSEAALGALFALSYAQFGFSAGLAPFLLSLACLAALVEYDLAHQILPPAFLAAFLAAAAIAGFFLAPSLPDYGRQALVALAIALFLALIHALSRGRLMGLADAPLAFGLALLAGPAALSGFIFSFWIGAVVGSVLLAWRPRGNRMGVEVPFAPFLAAGFLLAFFTQWNPVTIVGFFMARFLGV